MRTFYICIFALLINISCTTKKVPVEFTMNGSELTYKYSGGNAYNLIFKNDSVSYRFLSGSRPEAWWGPFSYNATEKVNGDYIVSWFEHGYGDYITLIVDANKKTLWGSGVIVKGDNSSVHFQEAEISEYIK